MSRIRNLTAFAALALLATASLVHAQGSTSTTTAAAPAAHHEKSSTSAKHESAPKVDINHATKEELMALKGVGDATADKIIAGRPYKAKNELESKNILTKKEYDAIAKHLVAHQDKAPASASK